MKPRSTLKDYFKKGAIPKESDFADLIDSMLVQDEDSVFKSPNGPLSIKATGAEETLLNFYRLAQGTNQLTWRLKQLVDTRSGLSIHEGDGADSRLFIESGSGNVGVGTTEPKSPLSVSGGLAVGASYAKASAAPANGLIVEGSVGIGTLTPGARLEIKSATDSGGSGALRSPEAVLRLYRDGISGQTWPNIAVFSLGRYALDSTNARTRLDIGLSHGNSTDTTAIMSIRSDGSVGIGTTEPKARLDVNGYIMGCNPFDRNFRDTEAPGGISDSARAKAMLSDKPNGTFIIAGPTPNYPFHIFFYWKGNNTFYRTWIPIDAKQVESF